MTINSFNSEFGYELIATIPYSYYLYKQGKLKKTISAIDTKCLYYFSPDHEETQRQRSWYYDDTIAVMKMKESGIPNSLIHKPLELDRWEPPPYKIAYKNDWAKFNNPTYVIYNRYNNEYPATSNKPINFFSIELIRQLFDILTPKYEILYCNVAGNKQLYDNAHPLEFPDQELCKEYGVTHIQDLLIRHSGLTYNQIQLYYFSNCEHFLTMNGGGSILTSYFGGRNLIYSKQSKELVTGDFGYYHLFGGSEIKVVTDYESILKEI